MKTLLTWIFWVDILAINLGLGYLGYRFWQSKDQKQTTIMPAGSTATTYVDRCGDECKAYIDSKKVSPTLVTTQIPTLTPVLPKTTTISAVQRVSYVSIPGNGGSTLQQEWTDVAGSDFYFDTKDYSGLVEIKLESTMQLVNGSGKAYVRLYDVTHGIGVQGSEVQTNSNSSTIVSSGTLGFWAGQNLIRVQVKSLTTESAMFASGRLRIVTRN